MLGLLALGGAPEAAASSLADGGWISAPAGADEGEASDGVLDGPDSILAWVDRFGGELPEDEVVEAMAEQVAESLADRALSEQLGGLDVPYDYYDDPERVLTGDPLLLDQLDLAVFDLPIETNDHVKKWMRLLLGPYRRYFVQWLARKSIYEDLILREADERGLPRDLIYLAMIESGFKPHALSHAHAAGLWQFIPATGRMYGLENDFWVDERRDPEKSTRAALTMLDRLHSTFGDWYLAFAAYNWGSGRLRRALNKLEADGVEPSYWVLLERGLLPRETQGYVPKILAAAILAKHPERYGFDDVEPLPPLRYDAVEVEGRVDVSVLAECAGMDEDDFRALNPALRRFAIPDGRTQLRIPVGQTEAFLAALEAVPPEERQKLVMHRIASGETLGAIAGRYGTTVQAIVDTNRLRNPNRVVIGQKLIIPVRSGEAPPASSQAVSASSATSTPPASYVVRRGDTLSGIAARYGLGMREIMTYNGLSDGDRLQVGQTLALRAPAPSGGSAASVSAASTYTVRAGDALSVIAERLGVSQQALIDANGIRNPESLRVGQVLQVPRGGSTDPVKPQIYTVRRGDALSRIAARHGVSLSDLMRWNDIQSASSIQIGQVLRLSAGGEAPQPSPQGQASTYRVKAGDALSVIAARHGVSMAALQSANGLRDPSAIQIGQVLTIPASEGAWTTHTVRSGESLGIIARRYGVTVEALQGWNGLKGATIYPGDTLKVPQR